MYEHSALQQTFQVGYVKKSSSFRYKPAGTWSKTPVVFRGVNLDCLVLWFHRPLQEMHYMDHSPLQVSIWYLTEGGSAGSVWKMTFTDRHLVAVPQNTTTAGPSQTSELNIYFKQWYTFKLFKWICFRKIKFWVCQGSLKLSLSFKKRFYVCYQIMN